ncbi:MAG: pyruvate dehydrogenase (acetyl-transferring) E1 component subunit alpha, partial [Hyphomonadaceae bacterium]
MAAKKSSGSAAVSPSNLVNRDEALAYYRDMLLIRRFEERAGQLYGMG